MLRCPAIPAPTCRHVRDSVRVTPTPGPHPLHNFVKRFCEYARTLEEVPHGHFGGGSAREGSSQHVAQDISLENIRNHSTDAPTLHLWRQVR